MAQCKRITKIPVTGARPISREALARCILATMGVGI